MRIREFAVCWHDRSRSLSGVEANGGRRLRLRSADDLDPLSHKRSSASALPLLLALLLAACERDMADQPKFGPLEAAAVFPNGQAARLPPEGTVARDADLAPVPDRSPLPVNPALLSRGQERYGIYCAPCHGRAGDGQGMIPERGFPPPPTYHSDRLRAAPDRHFYDVISHGYGVMFSYASRVAPEDRWAIIAYIRALQLSQNATLQDAREAGVADRLGETP
jgi:mono/diheme cytochrome c family protein